MRRPGSRQDAIGERIGARVGRSGARAFPDLRAGEHLSRRPADIVSPGFVPPGEAHSFSIVEIIETGGRAAHALGMIEEALRQAQLEREQIECLAIGVGPGSYNGIRAAIALAQGWQLARSIRLLSVSSAECLAA